MTYLIVTESTLSPAMENMMWGLLHPLGVRREDAALISVLGNQHPAGKRGKATAEQLRTAMPLFRDTISQTQARCVIPCGGPAFRAVTGLSWGIDSARGYIIPASECKPSQGRVMTQVGEYKRDNAKKGIRKGDPKFALRPVVLPPALPIGCEFLVPSITVDSLNMMQFKNVTAFRCAFRNAVRYAGGEPLIDDQFQWTDGVPPLGLDWSGVVAYDLEVPFDSMAVDRASLSSALGTWTFAWDANAVRAIREAMQGASLRVAHNQQFDRPILAAHGISVPEPQFDTMLAAATIEPDLPKGLDSVAPLYVLTTPWKHLAKERGFADPYYSAKDAFIERQLAIALEAKLIDHEMHTLFTKAMMPSVIVLEDMKTRGIRLHIQRTSEWCYDLEQKLMEVESQWMEKFPNINPTSQPQCKTLLYDTWNLPVQRRKGEGVTTDELALITLKALAPERADDLDLLLKIRETSKLLGTYGKTAMGREYIHPSYLPAGKDNKDGQHGKGLAATGRIATSQPNIQNQPKSARKIYIPDTDDMQFVEFDWSQAELRVAAALSGDKAMMLALEEDIHAHTMALLGLPKTEDGRRLAKAVLFGSAYGAGPGKLRETLLKEGVIITERECSNLQRGLALAYPRWWAWRTTLAEATIAKQYYRNPFGRVRRFPRGKNEVPAILDMPPQSTVADMAWYCYRPVWQTARDYGGRLTTVVHDSFLIQIPPSNLEGLISAVKPILEQKFPQVAPDFCIPADVKWAAPGASWGELKKESEWHAAV